LFAGYEGTSREKSSRSASALIIALRGEPSGTFNFNRSKILPVVSEDVEKLFSEKLSLARLRLAD
jgi:hypothetical protein